MEDIKLSREREMGMKVASMVRIAPFAAMVLSESLDVGTVTLSKAAMSKGLSHFVFPVYSNALATLIILPPAFFFFDRSKTPPVTFSILCKIFLLSLVGITVTQNCLYTGINYSSSTLASAMSNLTPAFTFVLAVTLRMEKFELGKLRSQMKVIGTLISIAGAFIVTFYKGPAILSHQTMNLMISTDTSDWVLGGVFILTACLGVAVYIIFQAAILTEYPSEMTVVAFYCLFGTVQCAVLSLIAERGNPNAWILSPGIELFSVIYSAVFGSVAIVCMQAWVIHTKGPVFAAIFKPVGVAIAALLGVILLGETLHVGLIVGAIVIITGFYGVIWAQSEDDNGEIQDNERLHSSTDTLPLLRNLNSA